MRGGILMPKKNPHKTASYEVGWAENGRSMLAWTLGFGSFEEAEAYALDSGVDARRIVKVTRAVVWDEDTHLPLGRDSDHEKGTGTE